MGRSRVLPPLGACCWRSSRRPPAALVGLSAGGRLRLHPGPPVRRTRGLLRNPDHSVVSRRDRARRRRHPEPWGRAPPARSCARWPRFLAYGLLLQPLINVATIIGLGSALGLVTEPVWCLLHYTPAHMLGTFLTVPPLVLAVRHWRHQRRIPRARYAEAALLTAMLVVSAQWVFGRSATLDVPALMYLLLPFLLWAAVRFGVAGTGTLLFLALVAFGNAVQQRGPFRDPTAEDSVWTIQLMLLALSPPLMFLAAALEERRRAFGRLQRKPAGAEGQPRGGARPGRAARRGARGRAYAAGAGAARRHGPAPVRPVHRARRAEAEPGRNAGRRRQDRRSPGACGRAGGGHPPSLARPAPGRAPARRAGGGASRGGGGVPRCRRPGGPGPHRGRDRNRARRGRAMPLPGGAGGAPQRGQTRGGGVGHAFPRPGGERARPDLVRRRRRVRGGPRPPRRGARAPEPGRTRACRGRHDRDPQRSRAGHRASRHRARRASSNHGRRS